MALRQLRMNLTIIFIVAETDHTVYTAAATAGKQCSGASMSAERLDPKPAGIQHVCKCM